MIINSLRGYILFVYRNQCLLLTNKGVISRLRQQNPTDKSGGLYHKGTIGQSK